MPKINLEQRSEEWFKWRKEGLGSSDIGIIMGSTTFKTPYELWEEKTGLVEAIQPFNVAIQRGEVYEEDALYAFLDENDFPILDGQCFEDDEHQTFKASLDGYYEEKKMAIEIKVPMPATYEKFSIEEYYQKYEPQVQWQLMVSGCYQAAFFMYSPEKREGKTIWIDRDEKIISTLREKALQFWVYVENKTPPPLDKGDYIELYGDQLQEWCDEYRRVSDEIKNLTTLKSQLKENIIGCGDGGAFTAYGIKAYRSKPSTTYDYEEMKKDGIDIEKYKKSKSEIGYYVLKVGKKEIA